MRIDHLGNCSGCSVHFCAGLALFSSSPSLSGRDSDRMGWDVRVDVHRYRHRHLPMSIGIVSMDVICDARI